MKAIVLAAGLSRRMRRQKLLLPYRGGTVLTAVLDAALAGPFDRVVLVTSGEVAGTPEIRAFAPRIDLLLNPTPEAGQSGSLKIGTAALSEGESFCVLLGDMPQVTAAELSGFVKSFEERPEGCTAMVPFRDDRPGHPVCFAPIWRVRLCESAGDAGGRELLRRWWEEVWYVPAPTAFFLDVDTPEDYASLCGGEQDPSPQSG